MFDEPSGVHVMRAIRAVVYGRVQGVFFRAYTVEEAARLGLAGWVRNRRDGTVECFAQGPEGAIEEFIQFLHRGSPASRVDRVEVHDEKPDPDIRSFKVVYR